MEWIENNGNFSDKIFISTTKKLLINEKFFSNNRELNLSEKTYFACKLSYKKAFDWKSFLFEKTLSHEKALNFQKLQFPTYKLER